MTGRHRAEPRDGHLTAGRPGMLACLLATGMVLALATAAMIAAALLLG